jgi:hypothetical protein
VGNLTINKKIGEIREHYDRSETELNVLELLTPRSGKILHNPTETKESAKEKSSTESRRYVLESFSRQQLLWELPLNKDIRFDLGSGMREGQSYKLKLKNVVVYAELPR